MAKKLSLTKLLKSDQFPVLKEDEVSNKALLELQRQFLRVQQGLWHHKKRAIIVFEGFDAAGKGGAIRRLVELLDPRGFKVHPIGPPDKKDQEKHYLYRFWKCLPAPGTIAIFDRSWYGRLLIEKVEKLTSRERIHEAYAEINEFEKTLSDDGIEIVKIFLAINKEEQLLRFEERLKDPYKQWKLTMDDVKARKHWREYVSAVDLMFEKTHTHDHPWHLIPANDKHYARCRTLEIVTKKLKRHRKWMEGAIQRKERIKSLSEALRELGLKKSVLG